MAYIYTSNTPEFLNFIAFTKTRDDIKNDPDLCKLLEDPLIKENMEAALLYHDAYYGDYAAKREYVGYVLANGPELDTDTLMYHREKILLNPSLYNAYKGNFADISIVEKLREEKYNKPVVRYTTYTTDYTEIDDRSKNEKKNDLLDCLQNPCDYLGPFSSSIGLVGDSKNFQTLENVFARITSKKAKEEEEKKKKEEEEKKKKEEEKNKKKTDSSSSEEPKASKDKNEESSEKDGTKESQKDEEYSVWGHIRQHVAGKVLPDLEKGYRKMMTMMGYQFQELGNDLVKNGVGQSAAKTGDKGAEEKANNISALVKTKIVSTLGDCNRIWEQMRRLKVYDPSVNGKKPFDTSMFKKNADGSLKREYQTQDDSALKPKSMKFTYGGEGKTWVYVKPKKGEKAKPTESSWEPPFQLTLPAATGTSGTALTATVDNSNLAGRIINTAMKVANYCRSNNFSYSWENRTIKQAPAGSGLTYAPSSTTDCSAGVWWVLGEAGLLKNPTGWPPNTVFFRKDFSSSFVDGVSVIEVDVANIQAGDIILWDRGKSQGNHIAIFASMGKCFDFGKTERIRAQQPVNKALTDKTAIAGRKVWRVVPAGTAQGAVNSEHRQGVTSQGNLSEKDMNSVN